ncbi:N-formylglutamate amidohydrolase [Gimibacter soli]|uniref:N-formylglutamate amidohydrolase n=1 Tax=Gimibacter soli TaxID=3024400 RepID=A0AAE9XTG6_9PROT|nr:N-formylglutamate amidohydrolase [Gimibacter soli]WCL53975.1 N-formylglutamate amidohydrolase [Gimibacter soli]
MQLTPISPEILNFDAKAPLVLLCDHASNAVPAEIGDLGVPAAAMQDHIAWDIGAEAVTRRMCEMMGVAGVIQKVSRLVIDVNRDTDQAGLIPEVSDKVPVPANQGLSDVARAARIDAYWRPFHAACESVIDAHQKAGINPLVVGIHSFTPAMNGAPRPWAIGFLWNRDPRLAQAMIGLCERETGLIVGDNEPYSGKALYYTMQRHGADRGLAQTTIEIRQDLMANEHEIDQWAALLADLLDECMTRPDLITPKVFP